MTLQEKIAVMQAAQRGEEIQVRDSVYRDHRDKQIFRAYGREWSAPYDGPFGQTGAEFNFRAFEYRVNPKEPREFVAVPFRHEKFHGKEQDLYALLPSPQPAGKWVGTIKVREVI